MYIWIPKLKPHFKLKKITISFLVTLLCFQTLGIYYFFNSQHKLFKEKIISKTEKSFVQKITLSLTDYENNLLDDHEIKFENKLYDIIEKKINGEIVELKVISDDDEKSFNSKYKNQSKKNSSNKGKQFYKTNLYNYFSENSKLNTSYIICYNRKILVKYNLKKIKLISREITIPPPEFI